MSLATIVKGVVEIDQLENILFLVTVNDSIILQNVEFLAFLRKVSIRMKGHQQQN